MKLNKDYQYTVLCEDVQSRGFISSFLKAQGIGFRKIRLINVPAERGCGEAFVKNNYVDEVLFLKKKNFDRHVLIVCMDADTHTIQERERYLELELKQNELTKGINRLDEFIILWIPKRQIENWIHFFREESTTEDKDYHHTGKPDSCKFEANNMSLYFQGLKVFEHGILPSIDFAKKEYDRICNMQK